MSKREEILKIIKEQVKQENIIKHMLATEACMEAIAREIGETNIEEWKLAGLAHDLDYQEGISEEEHGTMTGQIMEQEGIKLKDNILHAIAAHNWSRNGVKPQTDMAWALYSVDNLTGLIVATALVMDGKLDNVKTENVLNRFEEKNFASGARRENIKQCKQLGIPLKRFVEINLKAMQEISNQLEL